MTVDPTDPTPSWTTAPKPIDSHSLTAVTCVSAYECIAIDGAGNELLSTDVRTGTWTNIPTGDTNPLAAVSCEGTSLCVALDGTGEALISANPTAATPTWTQVSVGGGTVPTAIACSSNNSCLAGAGNAVFAAVVDPADPASTAWSSPTSLGGTNALATVSCESDGALCAAVDGDERAFTSRDHGATWSPAGIAGSTTALTCSTGECLAVQGANSYTGTSNADSGEAWSSAVIDPGATMNAVSCAGGGLCVGVDGAGNTITTSGFAGSTPPAWAVSVQDLTTSGARVAMASVSCPSARFCAAVDVDGDVLLSTSPSTTTWSLPTLIDGPGPGAGAVPLTSISCTAQGVCVAGDNLGRVVTSTNATSASPTWSAPTLIVGTGEVTGAVSLTGMSCSGAGLCVATAGDGEVFYTANPASPDPFWVPAATDGAHVNAVSCVGTGLCIGVDGVGEALVGTSSVGEAKPSATSEAFPDTVVGTTSPAQTLTVTNSGAATLNIGGVSLTGSDASEFALVTDGCTGAAVGPGTACTIGLAFAPTAAGAHGAASLEIASDAGTSPTAIALSGTGFVPSAIHVSGGTGSFAATTVGEASPAQTFTLTNSGAPGSALHITSAGLVGADAMQFTGADHGCSGATLPAGASCSVSVGFTPTSAGTHSAARLEIVSDASATTTDLPLSGTGLARKTAATPQKPLLGSVRFVKVTPGTGGRIALELRIPGAGRYVVRTSAKLPATKAASKSKRAKKVQTINYAVTSLRDAKVAGLVRLAIRPSKTATAALKRETRLRVKIAVTFAPVGGSRQTTTSAATARRK